MDIYRRPDFARGLFEALVDEVLAPWILFQKDRFPDATSINGADATASIPILNLNILEEWVVPYILRLREICGPQVYVPNWVGEQYLKDSAQLLKLKLPKKSMERVKRQINFVFDFKAIRPKKSAKKESIKKTLKGMLVYFANNIPTIKADATQARGAFFILRLYSLL